jgi:hypothetical protein
LKEKEKTVVRTIKTLIRLKSLFCNYYTRRKKL